MIRFATLFLAFLLNVSADAETKEVQDMPEHELSSKLLDAVDNEDMEEIKRLLGEGASPDIRIHDGRFLLHALLGHPGLAQEKEKVSSYLIKSGANIDIAFNNGITLLHLAAKMNLKESAKALIESGINKNKKSDHGQSALFYAQSVDMLKLLLENQVGKLGDLDANGNTLLHEYFESYPEDTALLPFLSKNIDINIQNGGGETALLKSLDTRHFTAAAEVNANTLLDAGAKVSLQDKDGDSALLRAVSNGFGVQLIDRIIESDGDIHQRDRFGYQAIHYAAQEGNDVFNLLVKKGADIHSVTTKEKYTPLHLAAIDGEVETIRFLLANNADKNVKNIDGSTPLNFAITNENEEIAELLRQAGAVATSDQELVEITKENERIKAEEARDSLTAYDRLKSAIQGNDRKAIEKYYKAVLADQDVEIEDFEVAELIISRSDENTLQFAIENGINTSATDDEGFGLLHLAVFYNNLGAAQLLIEKGLDIHAKTNDGDSVYQMTKNSSVEMLELLLKAGLKVSRDNEPNMVEQSLDFQNAVMAAHFEAQGYEFPEQVLQDKDYVLELVRTQDTETLAYLLSKGLSIESRVLVYGEMVTLLNAAVIINSQKMTSFILQAGGDPNARNSSGQPLYLDAFTFGDLEVIKALYNNGADVNDITGEGIHKKVPLLEALSNGKVQVAKILIDKGADISEVDHMWKDSPLHLAARLGDVSLLELIIAKGGDVHQLNEGRHAALDVAIKYEHADAEKYLRELEAKHPAR